MKNSPNEFIFTHGRIHTMDAALPSASAVVIRDGKFIYIGDEQGAKESIQGKTQVEEIDLEGACVIPGLTDAHMHFDWFATNLGNVNAEKASLAEALHEVRKLAKTKPGDGWVEGYGWNHNVWGGVYPSCEDLDKAGEGRPVYLSAKSGHVGWASSRALELAGITSQTPDPEGGRILRNEHGKPSGILLENAVKLVEKVIPPAPLEERLEAYRLGMEEAHRVGITGVHDMDQPNSLETWEALTERDELSLRVVKSIPLDFLEDAIRLGIRTGFGNDWLRIGAVKMFTDGALGSRTAWMLDPFEGEPQNLGINTTPIEKIRQAVLRANRAGLATAIHAIGDRAVREILNIYAHTREELGETGLRNRIEHVQLIAPEDACRLAELGVIASMQPIHATSDYKMAERFWGRRARWGYALKTQVECGAKLAMGSDCPVEPFNPMLGIHAAVTRRRTDGSPGVEGWYPEERLSVEEAVRGFTEGPAFAAGMEQRLGKIAEGYLADMTVLERDIFEIDPMDIAGVKVVKTVVGGAVY